MHIVVYIDGQVTPEQKQWAEGLRAKFHKVNFTSNVPFRKARVCDAYLCDLPDDAENVEDIHKAYAKQKDAMGNSTPVPRFEESMLEDDAEKRESVNHKKKRGRPKRSQAEAAQQAMDDQILETQSPTNDVPVVDAQTGQLQ